MSAALLVACASPLASTPTPIAAPTTTPTAVAPTPSPPLPSPTPSPTATAPPLIPTPAQTPDFDRVTAAVINGKTLRLEVADTSAERAVGLMSRTYLPEDAGMLFVFEREDYHTFWMKNTLIPLDIAFISEAGLVVDLQTMQPQPDVPDALLNRYRSAKPARFALEMNAGVGARLGIVAGTPVSFR